MPIVHRTDSDGVTRTVLTDVIRGEELVQHALELGAAGYLARPLLLDARAAVLQLSDAEIAWLADVVGGMRRVHGQASVALVTHDEGSSDVARRYGALMKAHNPRFAAFLSLTDAEAWVRPQAAGHPGPGHSRRDGSPEAHAELIGWARVHPAHVRVRLGIDPNRWYPVVEQPAAILSPPLKGYVWLDDGGRYRYVRAAFLEIVRTLNEEE